MGEVLKAGQAFRAAEGPPIQRQMFQRRQAVAGQQRGDIQGLPLH
jgi:hypothetical protein